MFPTRTLLSKPHAMQSPIFSVRGVHFLPMLRHIRLNASFEDTLYRNLKAPFVKNMYARHRLKETAVIPSYTRISPAGNKVQCWDKDTRSEIEMYPQWVPTYNPPTPNNPLLGTDYIPGVESFGEGIFLDIDVQNVNVRERYVFVHTFSHIIMKEMEFQCGYPLSSLKEKMYKKGVDHYGILIYTIGGSEGSYGGLISLLPTDPAATNGENW